MKIINSLNDIRQELSAHMDRLYVEGFYNKKADDLLSSWSELYLDFLRHVQGFTWGDDLEDYEISEFDFFRIFELADFV